LTYGRGIEIDRRPVKEDCRKLIIHKGTPKHPSSSLVIMGGTKMRREIDEKYADPSVMHPRTRHGSMNPDSVKIFVIQGD
jgi:hypothetical protein